MKKLLIVFAILMSAASLPAAALAFNPLNDVCEQPGAQNSPVCKQNSQQQSKNTNNLVDNSVTGKEGVIQTTANIMAMITGIVAVIMIIISGYQFITAGGNIGGQRAGDNPTKAKKARANIMSATIGLVVVALAWSITTYVIQHFVR